MREGHRAHAARCATTNATEDRDARRVDDGLRNRLLRSKRIDGEDGVGIAVLDDREVGGVDQRADLAAKDANATRLPGFLRHLEDLVPQPCLDDWSFLLCGRRDHNRLHAVLLHEQYPPLEQVTAPCAMSCIRLLPTGCAARSRSTVILDEVVRGSRPALAGCCREEPRGLSHVV